MTVNFGAHRHLNSARTQKSVRPSSFITSALGGQAGSVLVEGDFEQDAGAVLSFDIGGTTAGVGYGQIIVQGHAILGGTIEINLINGFVPSADPIDPDTFEIITYYSYEGVFDQPYIDLGNGLYFDFDYGETGITLVTTNNP